MVDIARHLLDNGADMESQDERHMSRLFNGSMASPAGHRPALAGRRTQPSNLHEGLTKARGSRDEPGFYHLAVLVEKHG
ncbi:hypothetical protein HJFPF1_05263 [Paramyrothecium foliicola]|nr:hypothetical protein HJFPF1_05263 [Paramyrothecium foliicola]